MIRALSLRQVRRALVIAPHPDDETIGCGGLIRHLRRGGARVDVLVVTNGAASHRNSVSHPPRRLAHVRAGETRAACAMLGVIPARLTMLGLADGGLTPLPAIARTRIARAAARHARADLVCLPDPDDAHPDHRAVAAACLPRLRAVRRLAYLVWPRIGRAPGRTHRLILGRDQAIKARALARHRTQLGAIRDDPTGFIIDPATRRRFTAPVEYYRTVPR
jgi:LmbE family N-acetylglucosaminyl deacetylase